MDGKLGSLSKVPCNTIRYSPVEGLMDSTLALQAVEQATNSEIRFCKKAGEDGDLSMLLKSHILNLGIYFTPFTFLVFVSDRCKRSLISVIVKISSREYNYHLLCQE